MAEKVVVGLSGGVDSSVTAAILHDQGYAVTGLTLWLMKGKGQCCSEGMVDAAKICEQLGVPHEIVDIRDNFTQNIVDYLVTGYQAGITPLPCSRCNRAVKFGPMLTYAHDRLGIDKIATGHYARISQNPQTGRVQLRRAVDRNKDQSYFLYEVPQTELGHCLFPLGELTKAETRQIAAEFDLATATKPESQDLCLVESHGSMRDFLDKYINNQKGKIVDTTGQVLGEHDGIHHYTIGQRKGLGIAAAHPLYVVAINAGKNEVIVGDRGSAQAKECMVRLINWVSIAPTESPIRAEVQIRYRSTPAMATVMPLAGDRARIIFDEPQFSITPGQAAVWYDGDLLLGGGLIENNPLAN
ncbi:tRNA (5-methylaminomethyl-2-thiouridylate)-methyltransferase [Thalassoporum mexicanum PCC 7367]|uniref:tRNA 2-thiouridine(34) synthase MnmA n=1 Tax=Thalassoporum mexicanum TaxID=3457544 RepID=UPI00029FEF37|nr:tRNA 2-thiouridine(34) synthase MnmA [Pseudanabaena sp. PCC 7367]AFY70086.1 tRNA (5-methylaminomethyl-2-thiouridylate)-methyltransferase [Pseudanabaena sp. PCC 7367]